MNNENLNPTTTDKKSGGVLISIDYLALNF